MLYDDRRENRDKHLKIGHIDVNSDSEGLINFTQILYNIHGLLKSFTDAPDLTNDAFWWLFSRNIIKKLKAGDQGKENYGSMINENVSSDEEGNIDFETERVKTKLNKNMIKKSRRKNFNELYEDFVTQLDKNLFNKYNVLYQIDIRG